MFAKKLITWKEADLAMVYLGFSMIATLGTELRNNGSDPVGSYPTEDGTIRNGQFLEVGNVQGWWSCTPTLVHLMGSGGFFANLPWGDKSDDNPSAVCWYSIQNLVRLRLRDARKEIHRKLMRQNKVKRSSRQSSRNQFGRKNNPGKNPNG